MTSRQFSLRFYGFKFEFRVREVFGKHLRPIGGLCEQMGVWFMFRFRLDLLFWDRFSRFSLKDLER